MEDKERNPKLSLNEKVWPLIIDPNAKLPGDMWRDESLWQFRIPRPPPPPSVQPAKREVIAFGNPKHPEIDLFQYVADIIQKIEEAPAPSTEGILPEHLALFSTPPEDQFKNLRDKVWYRNIKDDYVPGTLWFPPLRTAPPLPPSSPPFHVLNGAQPPAPQEEAEEQHDKVSPKTRTSRHSVKEKKQKVKKVEILKRETVTETKPQNERRKKIIITYKEKEDDEGRRRSRRERKTRKRYGDDSGDDAPSPKRQHVQQEKGNIPQLRIRCDYSVVTVSKKPEKPNDVNERRTRSRSLNFAPQSPLKESARKSKGLNKSLPEPEVRTRKIKPQRRPSLVATVVSFEEESPVTVDRPVASTPSQIHKEPEESVRRTRRGPWRRPSVVEKTLPSPEPVPEKRLRCRQSRSTPETTCPLRPSRRGPVHRPILQKVANGDQSATDATAEVLKDLDSDVEGRSTIQRTFAERRSRRKQYKSVAEKEKEQSLSNVTVQEDEEFQPPAVAEDPLMKEMERLQSESSDSSEPPDTATSADSGFPRITPFFSPSCSAYDSSPRRLVIDTDVEIISSDETDCGSVLEEGEIVVLGHDELCINTEAEMVVETVPVLKTRTSRRVLSQRGALPLEKVQIPAPESNQRRTSVEPVGPMVKIETVENHRIQELLGEATHVTVETIPATKSHASRPTSGKQPLPVHEIEISQRHKLAAADELATVPASEIVEEHVESIPLENGSTPSDVQVEPAETAFPEVSDRTAADNVQNGIQEDPPRAVEKVTKKSPKRPAFPVLRVDEARPHEVPVEMSRMQRRTPPKKRRRYIPEKEKTPPHVVAEPAEDAVVPCIFVEELAEKVLLDEPAAIEVCVISEPVAALPQPEDNVVPEIVSAKQPEPVEDECLALSVAVEEIAKELSEENAGENGTPPSTYPLEHSNLQLKNVRVTLNRLSEEEVGGETRRRMSKDTTRPRRKSENAETTAQNSAPPSPEHKILKPKPDAVIRDENHHSKAGKPAEKNQSHSDKKLTEKNRSSSVKSRSSSEKKETVIEIKKTDKRKVEEKRSHDKVKRHDRESTKERSRDKSTDRVREKSARRAEQEKKKAEQDKASKIREEKNFSEKFDKLYSQRQEKKEKKAREDEERRKSQDSREHSEPRKQVQEADKKPKKEDRPEVGVSAVSPVAQPFSPVPTGVPRPRPLARQSSAVTPTTPLTPKSVISVVDMFSGLEKPLPRKEKKKEKSPVKKIKVVPSIFS